MKLILTLLITVFVTSRLLAQEANTKELIHELQPLAWMIAEWKTIEVHRPSTVPWVIGDGGRYMNDVKMLKPFDVKMSDDGRKLVTTYAYSEDNRQIDVTEIIEWDAANQNLRLRCQYDYLDGVRREKGEVDGLLEKENNYWVSRVAPVAIDFAKPQFFQFERTLYNRSNSRVTLRADDLRYQSWELKPELQNLSWMLGDWRANANSVVRRSGAGHMYDAPKLRVRPSFDGKQLQIHYYFFVDASPLWACDGEVIEKITWDSDRKEYRVETSVDIRNAYDQGGTTVEPTHFLTHDGNNGWQEVTNDSARNSIFIQRTSEGLRRKGFVETRAPFYTGHPVTVSGPLVSIDFRKLSTR